MAHAIRLIRAQDEHTGQTVHRAKWLVCDKDTVIENGCVVLQGSRIRHAGSFDPKLQGPVMDHGEGVFMPCLVNAHVHLELSALKGKLPFDRGFKTWVQSLLVLREQTGIEALTRGIDPGVTELLESGTGVIGDISTLGIVRAPIDGLAGILFMEYLGHGEPDHLPDHHGEWVSSLAGHAPHTSSPSLLLSLKQRCRDNGLPFSIHVAESEDEMEFLTTGNGEWAGFLTERGIDFSDWGIPCDSPVSHLNRLGLLDAATLCVHLIRATPIDINILKEKNCPACLCPRSNHLLHGTLPPVFEMFRQGLCLCLGTDSLASTPTLNLWDEMAFLLRHVPELSPQDVFCMATENGARSLGLSDRYGRLAPGMHGPVVFVPIEAKNPSQLFERLVV